MRFMSLVKSAELNQRPNGRAVSSTFTQHWPEWEGEAEVRRIFGPEDDPFA